MSEDRRLGTYSIVGLPVGFELTGYSRNQWIVWIIKNLDV